MTLTTINLAALGDTINLATETTGTLGVTNGGTGLASGTTDQFLKFTGSTTIASAADNAGKINQVISSTRRGEYNISGNHGSGFATMEYPAITITPSASSSKVKLTWQVLLSADGTGYKTTDLDIQRAISGGATTSRLAYTADNSSIQGVAGRTFSGSGSVCQTPTTLYTLMWVDSPNTTSAVTYKLMSQATDNAANGNLYIFNNGQTCTYVGEEILA